MMTWPVDMARRDQPIRFSGINIRHGKENQALLPGSGLRNGKDEIVIKRDGADEEEVLVWKC